MTLSEFVRDNHIGPPSYAPLINPQKLPCGHLVSLKHLELMKVLNSQVCPHCKTRFLRDHVTVAERVNNLIKTQFKANYQDYVQTSNAFYEKEIAEVHQMQLLQKQAQAKKIGEICGVFLACLIAAIAIYFAKN